MHVSNLQVIFPWPSFCFIVTTIALNSRTCGLDWLSHVEITYSRNHRERETRGRDRYGPRRLSYPDMANVPCQCFIAQTSFYFSPLPFYPYLPALPVCLPPCLLTILSSLSCNNQHHGFLAKYQMNMSIPMTASSTSPHRLNVSIGCSIPTRP